MFTQLSSGQEQALVDNKCPHCHTVGNVKKVWTRNGPTVKCNACGKKVYRPRGRAVARGNEIAGGGVGGGQSTMSGQADAGQSGSGETGESSNGQPNGQQNGSPSQFSQAAQAVMGKPLSEAAKTMLDKIEASLKSETNKELAQLKQQVQKMQEQMKQELEQQVSKQVESLRPTEVIVKRQTSDGTMQQTTVAKAHKLLAEVLRRVNAGIRNFLFVGPSGSGKSTLARQIAEALNVPYGMLPWSGDTTPGTVLGRPSPDGSTFNPSPWLTLYTQASVFNHDELDGADPNVPICMNSAIENGSVFLPCGVFTRHADHIVIATANTWGIGADMLYCGRNQLDAAVRDRFVGGMLYVDYDADLESELVPEQQYRETFWAIRAKIQEHKLRRIWGTRALIRGASLIRGGYSLGETFNALTVGYSPDELQKIGVA